MLSLHRIRHVLMASALAIPVAACAPNPPPLITSAPTSVETTATYKSLRNLPAPQRPVPVAVYSYPDLTGQFKPSETVSTNSRAVTQGAVWMLVKALKDAAGGQWFKVTQRANLDNLLRERQIIRETRGRVEKSTGRSQPALPSLLFAGVILEGGIIGYDSNTITGGLGARYLGIGGDVQYRQDTVTVYLNAISSQTGEVMKSVMTRKTVASYGVRGSVFKFVAFQRLLEGETGYTINEPGQIALAQAIEHAVRALIIEGALEGLWQFENEDAGKEETQAYLADKDDHLLIGDATSEAALALLTDEQLHELAKRNKERRKKRTEIAKAEPAKPAEPAAKRVASSQPIAPPRPAAPNQDVSATVQTTAKAALAHRSQPYQPNKVVARTFQQPAPVAKARLVETVTAKAAPKQGQVAAKIEPAPGTSGKPVVTEPKAVDAPAVTKPAKTVDTPDPEQLAAQARLAKAFAASLQKAVVLNFDLERLPDEETPPTTPTRTALADIGKTSPVYGPRLPVTPTQASKEDSNQAGADSAAP